MKSVIALLVIGVLSALLASPALAHCEIPCGIYDDEARANMIAEHITTIEKSMNQIAALSAETPLNHNQITRWIQNKENHADELQHIATQYFMTQRVKPADKEDTEAYAAYTKKLTLLHQIVVYAMKAKQTTDLANVEKLRSLLTEFKKAYFVKHGH
jgi:nickel superoxide dismutase